MNDRAGRNISLAIPDPMLDDRELADLQRTTQRYEDMMKPKALASAAKKAAEIIPENVKDAAAQLGKTISEQEIYAQALKLITEGFKVLEREAAKVTVSEQSVVKAINDASQDASIETLEEVCTVRSYDVAKAANKQYGQHIAAAVVEGGGTGAAGFAGIPANMVLSTFLFYRAVQSIAMSYGYDVKNNPDELIIASDVFANAMSPSSKGSNGVSDNVAKFMAISAAEGIKQAAGKSWAAMIEEGAAGLLLAQIRALAHASAKKALENAGKKSLENSIFRELFEQLGKRLTLKTVQRAVPVISAGIGAFIDTAQMNKVLTYANIFYQKRFLVEKESRVMNLVGIADDGAVVADVETDDADAEPIPQNSVDDSANGDIKNPTAEEMDE